MNIHQMQALDYVLKTIYLEKDAKVKYKIIFKMDGELYSGEFLNVDTQGTILDNPTVDSLGMVTAYPYHFDPNHSAIGRMVSVIFPDQTGPFSQKLQVLLKNGDSLQTIYKRLKDELEITEGVNNLLPVIYNLESLSRGYTLPFLGVEEHTEIEWVSLDIA